MSKIISFFIQPLADAVYYKNHEVIKLLEKNGAKPPVCFSYILLLASQHFLQRGQI